MTREFQGWEAVAAHIRASLGKGPASGLNQGQMESLRRLAKALPEHGMILADEVGMGKTRIAAAVVRAVVEAGGRAAILIPPNLGAQWRDECRVMGVVPEPPLFRSVKQPECKDPELPVLLFSHYFRVKDAAFSAGPFELVVIDEAHKSRAEGSGLNRLLHALCGNSPRVRRLGLTATPIELEAGQWLQMLERVGVGEEREDIAQAVTEYVDAVARVRAAHTDKARVGLFRTAAKRFEECLRPYVLRRDKRGEKAMQCYAALTGRHFHTYREVEPIRVDTARQDEAWKQAVCAAEALSFAARHTENRLLKRLRLTLANGHGIASLLEQAFTEARDEAENGAAIAPPAPGDPVERKREERIRWWLKRLRAPFADPESALAGHPAILAAVEYIESVCGTKEKVLVFGRFKAPLRALTRLLNAREMLRCLDGARLWPQAKLSDSDWDMVKIADRQLHGTRKWRSKAKLDAALDEQYRRMRNGRKSRTTLLEALRKGFAASPDPWAESLLDALCRDMRSRSGEEFVPQSVTRGIQELLGTKREKAGSGESSRAFAALMRAVSGQGKNDAGARRLARREAEECWEFCRDRLREEYQGQGGRFARLMDGSTEPATRRFLQLAFNRERSDLKVLVAQSRVGREGLNLHTACRTVVLLHLEWNPGVVEQQIGRVDRIGSLWEQWVLKARKDGAPPAACPRIHVRPVIFQGTYDERQWSVLERRWGELRAQLHGLILLPDESRDDPEAHRLIVEINGAAPDFSPAPAPPGRRARPQSPRARRQRLRRPPGRG